MNTRFLEAFVWAVRLGSFRGAAERLNMTQAAISSRIASLEDEFGQRLFDRDAWEIRLTASGRVLLGYAERILELGRDMGAAMKTGSQLSGVLRIGVAETIVHTWLTDFMTVLRDRHGALEVHLTAEPTLRLHEDLRRGMIDIAIQTDAVLQDGVRNRDIGSMPMGWVGLPAFCAASTTADLTTLASCGTSLQAMDGVIATHVLSPDPDLSTPLPGEDPASLMFDPILLIEGTSESVVFNAARGCERAGRRN